jgi:hypothetical protein
MWPSEKKSAKLNNISRAHAGTRPHSRALGRPRAPRNAYRGENESVTILAHPTLMQAKELFAKKKVLDNATYEDGGIRLQLSMQTVEEGTEGQIDHYMCMATVTDADSIFVGYAEDWDWGYNCLPPWHLFEDVADDMQWTMQAKPRI